MYATYLRLDFTVHDGWRTVVRAAASKLARSVRFDPARRKDRHRFYRRMFAHHRRAQRLISAWRL